MISDGDIFSTADCHYNGQNYRETTFARSTIKRRVYPARCGRVLSSRKYGVNGKWYGLSEIKRSTDMTTGVEAQPFAAEPSSCSIMEKYRYPFGKYCP